MVEVSKDVDLVPIMQVFLVKIIRDCTLMRGQAEIPEKHLQLYLALELSRVLRCSVETECGKKHHASFGKLAPPIVDIVIWHKDYDEPGGRPFPWAIVELKRGQRIRKDVAKIADVLQLSDSTTKGYSVSAVVGSKDGLQERERAISTQISGLSGICGPVIFPGPERNERDRNEKDGWCGVYIVEVSRPTAS